MISLQLQRYGGIARTTGILSWMVTYFFGKRPERQGGGVLFMQVGKKTQRIKLCLGVDEEGAKRLWVRIKG